MLNIHAEWERKKEREIDFKHAYSYNIKKEQNKITSIDIFFQYIVSSIRLYIFDYKNYISVFSSSFLVLINANTLKITNSYKKNLRDLWITWKINLYSVNKILGDKCCFFYN
jgi:hypothetical protein